MKIFINVSGERFKWNKSSWIDSSFFSAITTRETRRNCGCEFWVSPEISSPVLCVYTSVPSDPRRFARLGLTPVESVTREGVKRQIFSLLLTAQPFLFSFSLSLCLSLCACGTSMRAIEIPNSYKGATRENHTHTHTERAFYIRVRSVWYARHAPWFVFPFSSSSLLAFIHIITLATLYSLWTFVEKIPTRSFRSSSKGTWE